MIDLFIRNEENDICVRLEACFYVDSHLPSRVRFSYIKWEEGGSFEISEEMTMGSWLDQKKGEYFTLETDGREIIGVVVSPIHFHMIKMAVNHYKESLY